MPIAKRGMGRSSTTKQGRRFLWAVVVSVVLCPANNRLISQESALWGGLKPGEYSVGFRVMESHDRSRRWHDETGGRPVQISVWYPASGDSNVPPMIFRDYFLLSVNELDVAGLSGEGQSDAVSKYEALLVSNGIPQEAVRTYFATPMAARPALAMAEGSFPLVIVAQGNFHSAHHQAVLCEFLASHGYVVATSPSQTRISGPMKSDDEVYPNIVEQSEDITFLRNLVAADFRVDTTRIGLVGHSFGARSALLYLADHAEVKGLVSLDGGIGNKQGKGFIKGKRGFDPSSIRAPILHFYEDVESFMTPDFDLITSLTNSTRFLVRVERMHHAQFTTFGMAGGTIPGFSERADETGLKCEAILNITLCFLDEFVRHGDAGSGGHFMKKINGLLPRGLMSLSRIGD